MDDKLALRASQAGMRFIAQMTIYNSGDSERLARFIEESYHPDALTEEPLAERLDDFLYQQETLGRVKVRQVIGTGKHHVLIMVEAERVSDHFLNEMKVEEDYPHRVTEFNFVALE
jgi:hypothetical protein